MNESNSVSGSVAGTGAAINELIGFKPSKVVLYNPAKMAQLTWFNGMGAGKGIKDMLGNLMGRPAVINWGLFAGLIGVAFFISIVLIVFMFIRYRRVNRRLWPYRFDANKRIFNQVTIKK